MTNKLKVARAEYDMTQEELAKKVAVSRQTINSIEKNRYVPSTLLALKIAHIFNKSIHDLFYLEGVDWE